jgi:hypothetical protein
MFEFQISVPDYCYWGVVSSFSIWCIKCFFACS